MNVCDLVCSWICFHLPKLLPEGELLRRKKTKGIFVISCWRWWKWTQNTIFQTLGINMQFDQRYRTRNTLVNYVNMLFPSLSKHNPVLRHLKRTYVIESVPPGFYRAFFWAVSIQYRRAFFKFVWDICGVHLCIFVLYYSLCFLEHAQW